MWWLWPHLRRIWAGTGAVIVGLIVSYLYSLSSKQPLPDQRIVSNVLADYWRWLGGGLVALAIVSVFAARAHRRHAAPHFIGDTRRARKRAKLPPLPAPAASTLMVGREDELAQIRTWFASVFRGERRVVFVGGEAGIGKTTFVRAFLDSLGTDGAVRLGRGQCVQQYGAGEPYMPMLEALTQLGRGADGLHLIALLHRLAPAWLAQLPALLTAEERARIQGESHGLTQQRMLREMADALAAIAAERPLVILLEDLHWSDASTLDLIAAIARRSEPARLLILGTYRPVEMLAGDHPLRALKQELELHQHCQELRLKLLNQAEVGIYLGRRFAGDGAATQYSGLAPAIYQRSEGNPLFMVNVVDYLVAQGRELDTSKIEAPRNIRQMIEHNLERLTPDEQSVLEGASVAGAEFSAAAVAAALERPMSEIEACCTRLSRQEQFVGPGGMSEWPDGTVASKVRFLHALYRDVLYGRVPNGHRVELHRRIAGREETAYGDRAGEIAAELADHFSRANDKQKAVQYFQLAGERAARRFAYREAETHFRSALLILEGLPQTADRDERELAAVTGLRFAVAALKGPGDEQLATLLERAAKACRRMGRDAGLADVLRALAGYHAYVGHISKAAETSVEALEVATRESDPALIAWAHSSLGGVHYWMGLFPTSRAELERALDFYVRDGSEAQGPFETGALPVLLQLSRVLWMLGFPDQSRKRSSQFLELAKSTNHPVSIAEASAFVTDIHYYCGELHVVEELLAAVRTYLSRMESEYPQLIGWPMMLAGWAMAQRGRPREAIGVIRDGFTVIRASGQRIAMPIFGGLMAVAQSQVGEISDALQTTDQTLRIAEETGQHYSDSELQRLRGEFLLMCDGKVQEAEVCLRAAVDIARRQCARSWELRATTSFARLLDHQGRRDEARAMLAEIYNWFTEGFDTADLKQAKALLEDLSANRAEG